MDRNTWHDRIENYCNAHDLDFEIRYRDGRYIARVYSPFNSLRYDVTTEGSGRKIASSYWATIEYLIEQLKVRPYELGKRRYFIEPERG